MTPLRKINVVLIDDNPDTLRHLKSYIALVTEDVCGDESVQCKLHAFGPVPSHANPSKIDIDETLEKIIHLNPGVAIIGLKLEGDAEDDYTGAVLALRIKKSCNECCIILVSSYFEAVPGLLDNIEIFRFRVDRNQADYGKNLQAQFIDAVRNNVSAINLRRFLEGQPTSDRHLNQSPSRVVYISYARGSSEDIVNHIEESLKSYGYDVRRDTNNIPYTALISSFMKEIGRGRCIIVVISDKYLRSPYCMYELLEVYRNEGFHKRVCPVVLNDVQVSSIPEQFAYVEYWSSQVQQFDELIRKINLGNLAPETLEEFFKFRDISQNAAKLLAFIVDMQHLNLEELENNDFAVLRERIDQCLNGVRSPDPSRESEPSEGSGRKVPKQELGNQQGMEPGNQQTLNPKIQSLLDEINHPATKPTRRLAIGDEPDKLGDPRRGVGLDANGLPDIEWMEIPGGPFIYQNGETRKLPTYWISRYPITNRQFQAFIDAGGYQNQTDSVLKTESVLAELWKGLQQPQLAKSSWSQGNRPRTDVDWYEAVAFTRWLSAVLGLEENAIRLPTEQEWEKAARGTSGLVYPWGNEYQSGFANINETWDKAGPWNLQQTTAVGLYPQGRSPYEVEDMAGTVREWCLNKYEKPEVTESDISGDSRVVRGGSWISNQDLARADFRDWSGPENRIPDRGFRVLSAVPIHAVR
ncbi:MAG: SUMF1/EgtB/PvdO family nonheme iron enzyme [Proteobacteria bacterium]|nr:SUMF1/EgtB/PvdO family nonheme iron enzyme [Pseudomonadota bacterium]